MVIRPDQRDSLPPRWPGVQDEVCPRGEPGDSRRGNGRCEACGRPRAPLDDATLSEYLDRQANAIAQALHDESGQLLSAAHLTLSELSTDVSAHVRRRIDDVRRYLDSIEEQLRRIAYEIRPPALEQLGLGAALHLLADSVGKRRGLAITVDVMPSQHLPPAIETALYRVVQEALNNVTRHAHTASARIQLRRIGNTLHCSVQDDGVGFDADAAVADRTKLGMGFVGMRERVAAVGGRLDVRSAPGRGTDVLVNIPLEA